MDQEAASEFCPLPLVKIFRFPVVIAARIVQKKVAGPQFRWDAHITFDKGIHPAIEKNLLIGWKQGVLYIVFSK